MSYTVRVQNASGQARDYRVTADSENRAIREALRRAEQDSPGAKWLPIGAV